MYNLRCVAVGIVFAVGTWTTAMATNSVTVQSMQVAPNATDVVIPVYLTNDTALESIVTPFIIRPVSGGAYITAAKGSFGDRLPPDGPLSDIIRVTHYDVEDGTCKWWDPDDPPEPGGFKTPAVLDTNSHPVSAAPYCVMFARFYFPGFSPPLLPGSDVTGSFLLTVDINDQEGVFEVDTTCVDPANRLIFVGDGFPLGFYVYPTFEKGVITVGRPGATRTAVDIKPQSCPNPLNVRMGEKSKGVLPVAILGSADFDVTEIDASSVMLEGVAPIRWSLQDVATPVVTDPVQECDCTTDGPDGFDDLTLKFPRRAVIDAIGAVNNRDEIVLTLTGMLLDGTAFEGSDCVLIRAEKANSVNTDLTAGSEFAAWSYPNPFNAATTIRYRLVADARVSLVVYNVLGQEVISLINDDQSVGEYSVLWNGRDASDREVASGVYFYRLQAGNDWLTRKMTLLK